jgi:DNA-binding response OmpR family regulator
MESRVANPLGVILLLLLASPGQLVSRDLIREQLWAADTFVDFEHSLDTAIKKLRQNARGRCR